MTIYLKLIANNCKYLKIGFQNFGRVCEPGPTGYDFILCILVCMETIWKWFINIDTILINILIITKGGIGGGIFLEIVCIIFQ